MIETQLPTFLGKIAALAAIVGVSPNGRIYPVFCPKDATAPYVVFRRISPTTRPSAPNAATAAKIGITCVFRVTCWATTYGQALTMAAAIVAACHNIVPGSDMPTTRCLMVVDEADQFEPSAELDQLQYFGRYVDIQIRHT